MISGWQERLLCQIPGEWKGCDFHGGGGKRVAAVPSVFRGMFDGSTFDEVEGAVCSQVGSSEAIHGAAANDGAFPDDTKADAFDQCAEVVHGHEVDVWGFVPFVGESFSDGSAAASEHFHADTPVSEVGDDDEPASCHAEHFSEQLAGIADLLEGLAEHSEIKAVVGDVREALVEVCLDGGESPLDDSQEVFLFDFDAEHIAVEFEVEALHQSPVTTPQVDYSTAAGDVLHDEFVSEADGGIGDLVTGTGALGHGHWSLVRAVAKRWQVRVRVRQQVPGAQVTWGNWERMVPEWRWWRPCFRVSLEVWED